MISSEYLDGPRLTESMATRSVRSMKSILSVFFRGETSPSPDTTFMISPKHGFEAINQDMAEALK